LETILEAKAETPLVRHPKAAFEGLMKTVYKLQLVTQFFFKYCLNADELIFMVNATKPAQDHSVFVECQLQ